MKPPTKKHHYFITGTDTEVGKTTLAAALLTRAHEQGHTCIGIKPVTAGCIQTDNALISEDADTLLAASNTPLHPDLQAPIKLLTACSPHIAADIDGQTLSAARITGMVRGALSTAKASHILVEGAGGWFTPINARETLADVAKQVGLPVILVVGIKLGCLNHALLTVQAIHASGLTLAGWIANEVTADTAFFTEQVTTLAQRIPATHLGVVRYGEMHADIQWPEI